MTFCRMPASALYRSTDQIFQTISPADMETPHQRHVIKSELEMVHHSPVVSTLRAKVKIIEEETKGTAAASLSLSPGFKVAKVYVK